ncbi:general substrate transporter [Aspergillus avenaceus]|uniref:General substrate transporter n=1 Tax=Aspergillus avenaceus TaxID=36643 RepID=A0A5N6U856_ASPAV|nr:general substrate transporter [Aspergillus avenaceus]
MTRDQASRHGSDNVAQEPETQRQNVETEHPNSADAQSEIVKPGAPVMRSKADDLSVWQTVRRYRTVSLVAMTAAFSAALDGYQINLNGGVISNKGFIRQMAKPGTTIIEGKYVSAWGGIQSAGQTVGQVFLQYATESLGRKVALYIIWVTLVISVFIESFATRWDHWLVAKLFSGMGVGMLQSTLPLYLSEIAPTQLRGFFINAYTFWFVLGQIFASVALNRLNAASPMDFRTPIYTQWAMVGVIAIIFVIIPETPWWLVSKGKFDQATKVLRRCNGSVEGYNVSEQIEIMSATVVEERRIAERDSQEGQWAVFQGRNLIRFIIAGWPKITQQFVGLSVFNTFATYFFQYAGSDDPFLVTVILSCVQLISMIITVLLTDQFGRRPLTVYPYAVTTLSVLCLGIIGCVDYTQKATSSLLIFFACLATFTTTGASAIGYAYAAEIPQQRLRARTAGWSLAVSNLIAIMFSFCTPLMINEPPAQWGVKTGFFFAGTGTVTVIISWFILPEVTRRTPAEIDEMFEKKVNLRKFKNYVTEVQMYAAEQHEMKAT